MLGCHDFCGYYEWTFHFLRRRFGTQALERYWREAIAADSQRHYIRSGNDAGLRGLYESWLKTGDDEQCDWTVTLDENKNLLRLDMRQCPSKGFLLDNNLNADEDYCDHCMGWVGPALTSIAAEVAAHEHNHCGQCWWEIRLAGQDQPTVEVSADIRNDPRWAQGYLHRYAHREKLPLLAEEAYVDSGTLLVERFRQVSRLIVLGPSSAASENVRPTDDDAVIVVGQRYAAGESLPSRIDGVLLEHEPKVLAAVAERFHATAQQPLLMHCYLPIAPILNFAAFGLPRAVPILPLLIRSSVYTHDARQRHPSIIVFAALLAAALNKSIVLRGFETADSQPLDPADF